MTLVLRSIIFAYFISQLTCTPLAGRNQLYSIQNLRFCTQFNGAVVSRSFFDREPIQEKQARLDITAREKNESLCAEWSVSTIKDFYFDFKAKWTHREKIECGELQRFICHQLMLDSWKQIHSIDPDNYFPEVGYGHTIDNEDSLPRVNMAYMILAHQDFETVQNLALTLTEDSNSMVIIHADHKSFEFRMQLEEWISDIEDKNIMICSKSYTVYWAYSSILKAQQACIIEAYQLFNWDAIAVISGDSYPLHSNAFIHDYFIRNGKRTMLGLRPAFHHCIENPLRIHGPPILATSSCGDKTYAGLIHKPRSCAPQMTHTTGIREKAVMGENWVFLSRDFVRLMITNPDIASLNMRLEFSIAPEEYFYYFAAKLMFPDCSDYHTNIDKRSFMFKRWPKIPNHPIEVSSDEFDLLEEASRSESFLFVRKIFYKPDNYDLFDKVKRELLK